MGVGELFWLFIVISSLQPVIRQKLIEASRQRLIAKLERERGSRVILLVHRQETMALLGFPVMRFIDINDSEEVLRAIHLTDDAVPLDIVLHTPGGLVLASLQIARALSRHKAKVTVVVPHYAMSGGTLIALAADEIVMSEHAVLGPVDPQIGEYPAASLLKVLEKKPIPEVDDKTVALGDIAEKALVQLKDAVREIVSARHPQLRAEELAVTLSSGKWTHDYPIIPAVAKDLGLDVRTDIPDDFLQLMSLFPQPLRRAPSVLYLPTRREADPGADRGEPRRRAA